MKKNITLNFFLCLKTLYCIRVEESENYSSINKVYYEHAYSLPPTNNQDNILPNNKSAKCNKRPHSSLQNINNELSAPKRPNHKQETSNKQRDVKKSGSNKEYKLSNAVQQKDEYINKYNAKKHTTDSHNKQIDSSTYKAVRNKRKLKKRLNISTTNNCDDIWDRGSLLKHKTEKICSTTFPIFLALEHLFKSVLYYRLNIGKFLNTFHYKIQDEQNENISFRSKEALIEKFIDLSIEFAKNTKGKGKPELSCMTSKTIEETKNYETAHIKNLKNTKQKYLLIDSTEYRKINDFNHIYNLNLNAISSALDGFPLKNFLQRVFEKKLLVSKYYYMLSYFIGSLYDISLIINKTLDQADDSVLDKTIFEVCDCSCSEQTKKNFVFHWGFCWISYFSKYYSLPKPIDVRAKTLAQINQYPKEFVVQFIVLVHYNINIEHTYTETKYLDKQALLILKQTITDLLFKNLKYKNISLFQLIIYNLYRDIKEIKHPAIYRASTVNNIRMLQTHKEQLYMMNKLIPAIKNLNNFIFDLTKEAYRLAKRKIDRF